MSDDQQDSSVAATVSRRAVLAATAAVGAGAAGLGVERASAAGPDQPKGSSAGVNYPWKNGALMVSDNGRYLQHTNGEPFFWLADTAWLLHKLSRDDMPRYFTDRRTKGYNVVQLQVVPASLEYKNYYGEIPFTEQDIRRPNPAYWRHVDFIVDQAAKNGMYMGMDAVWSAVVSGGHLSTDDAGWYGTWIARRYRDRPNIVWLNGGDAMAHENLDVWNALGAAIRKADPHHLMTFHPFGRFSSSTWFHTQPWLDFNMFQSGHRTYAQCFAAVGTDVPGVELPTLLKGEDNWKNVIEDYKFYPAKPTLDGEPSYEGIPQGLHDPTQPFWNDDDVRRYAYWSVFGGSCGHTYGNGSVMQIHVRTDAQPGAYGVTKYWDEAIQDPGAGQLQYLKKLILSRPYFSRIYDPTVIDGDPGFQHDRVVTTRGDDFLLAYSYTGRSFTLQLGHISGSQLKAWWYRPKDGTSELIGQFKNDGAQSFDPPGEEKQGNDWVLVLDDAAKGYAQPGQV